MCVVNAPHYSRSLASPTSLPDCRPFACLAAVGRLGRSVPPVLNRRNFILLVRTAGTFLLASGFLAYSYRLLAISRCPDVFGLSHYLSSSSVGSLPFSAARQHRYHFCCCRYRRRRWGDCSSAGGAPSFFLLSRRYRFRR